MQARECDRLVEQLRRVAPHGDVRIVHLGQQRRELPPIHDAHRPECPARPRSPVLGGLRYQRVAERKDERPVGGFVPPRGESLQPLTDLKPFRLTDERVAHVVQNLRIDHHPTIMPRLSARIP
jgi:hypothetical protein